MAYSINIRTMATVTPATPQSMKNHRHPIRTGLLTLTTALVLIANVEADAATQVATVLQSSMVLQRGRAVPIWGTDTPGTTVTVTFAGQTKAVLADAGGQWKAFLDPLSANAVGATLTVTGSTVVAFSDVLVGDVWLASGQSNMEWPLQQEQFGSTELALNANQPLIRLLRVNPGGQPTPQDTFSGTWQVCSAQSAASFSAVAYYFAQRIRADVNVPLGIIGSYWGGSCIRAWCSREALMSTHNFCEGFASGTTNCDPAALYNAMIHPLIPYAIKGAIWYQGESDVGSDYVLMQQTMVRSWREEWQQGDFPFYYVAIAPYYGIAGPLQGDFWNQQFKLMSVTNSGLAVISDYSAAEYYNLHPIEKKKVGERLAYWALRQDYVPDKSSLSNLPYSGPLFRFLEATNGKVVLHFDHAESGLTTWDGASVKGFEIAGLDGVFKQPTVTIKSDTLELAHPEVTFPYGVRMGYLADATNVPNLANGAGLLAAGFSALNNPPQVSLLSPANGAVLPASSVIPLNAQASDANGTVTNVEFFVGGTKLGQVASPPFSTSWSNPPDGHYVLSVTATDNDGIKTTSKPVKVTVGSPSAKWRYEAENATYDSTITVNQDGTASGCHALVMQAAGTITWIIPDVPASSNYDISIGYLLPSGEKHQNLSVNGGLAVSVVYDGPVGIWQEKVVNVALNAGTNTIAISADWGYQNFDYLDVPFGLLTGTNAPIFLTRPADRPVVADTTIIVTNRARSADGSTNAVAYQLLNPPAGAAISSDGVISWSTRAAQASNTFLIQTVARAGLSGATNEFRVTVLPRLASRFEAESALITPGMSVRADAAASGGACVDMQTAGVIVWTIPNVPAADTYDMVIGFDLAYDSPKTQNIRVNNSPNTTAVVFAAPSNTWQVITVPVTLNAGTNTINIESSWGYELFDYIELPLVAPPPTIFGMQRLPGGGFMFLFDVPPGKSYTVEVSDDLVQWQAVYSGTGTEATESYTDSSPSLTGRRFYRLRF
jgi:sialate O-acetylesterase